MSRSSAPAPPLLSLAVGLGRGCCVARVPTGFFPFLAPVHHYGRAVVMFGVPYVYTQSRILKVGLAWRLVALHCLPPHQPRRRRRLLWAVG